MANETREFEAFKRQIDSLDIELSVNEEGAFTVCTHAEPFFCFDADSKEEAGRLVGRALASYGRLFFGLEGLPDPEVRTIDAAADFPVAVERGKPVGQLRPQFDLAA